MQKSVFLISGIVVVIVAVVVLISIYSIKHSNAVKLGYTISSGIQQEEFERIISPDGKVDAVALRVNAGAMSSYNYLVYIVPAKQKPSKDNTIIFDAEKIENLNISWTEDRQLLIQYKEANIYKFRNHIYPLSSDYSYLVKIREQQTFGND